MPNRYHSQQFLDAHRTIDIATRNSSCPRNLIDKVNTEDSHQRPQANANLRMRLFIKMSWFKGPAGNDIALQGMLNGHHIYPC